jgi:lipopolysaccharide cholinephosphotransferase
LRSYAVHLLGRILFTVVNINKWRDSIENHLRSEAKRYSGKYLWPWLCWGQVKDASKVARYKKEWFNDTVLLPFEDIEMPCPVGWKNVLESQYGDWQIPIKGSSLHEGAVFIPNKPYKEYIADTLREMSWWQKFKHTH